jgi:hypothetical protein
MLNSPTDQKAFKGRQLAHRSRVTNGHSLLPDLPGIDGRSAWVRRCRDLIGLHLSDLGGRDNCSVAEASLVRRASVVTVELEQLEAKFAAAGRAAPADLETYQRCTNTLRRLLESIGLQRRARDVTSSASETAQLTSILERLQESV